MKVFLPHISWEGGFGGYFQKALISNGIEVVSGSARFHRNPLLGLSKLRSVDWIRNAEYDYYSNKYGELVLKQCVNESPDVFMVFNESSLSPLFIKKIKEHCKCLMVLLLGDDPWDSIRWNCDFPHSLKYFDLIFSGDPTWNNNIRKVAPQAKIYWHFGGYDPDRFFPLDESIITTEERLYLSCDLAFTGSSYAKKAEGAYRSDLLTYLTDYNLKIWGGDNWKYRFKYNSCLETSYRGSKLTFDHLTKLYSLCKIFINLPAPQICHTFQPRVFEIAGCGGFQIADNRLLLRYLFNEDELCVFDTIGDLKDQIDYYLDHESERKELANRLNNRVKERYTWQMWASRILKTIETGNGIEDLDLLLIKSDQDELKERLRNA